MAKIVTSRRAFLKMAGAASAAAATTLWLPKRARGTGPSGSIKRVILIFCNGGVRWDTSFDGKSDVSSNPWGLVNNLAMLGATAQPEWGFSRMLMQRPVPQSATGWKTSIYPHLSSDDFYN